ncbi:MAG: RagB/SusD family nutrient uptake outer membrane protein [Bacteroidaceae bacterium]|nr:RagB/SusD family nutrient uptake outer membrane protein [Bacteroidaceae bacterium]
MKIKRIFLFALPTVFALNSCVDLEYNEVSLRDEEWTYEFFNDGVKNMIWDVYAQMYSDELSNNSTSFLAGATDEAQYALEIGAVNNYFNGGWSTANPMASTWNKSYTALAEIHTILEKIDKIDLTEWRYDDNYEIWQQQLDNFPYELRFLRAYFYFELFKTYGDVPLVTTTLTNGQANNVERTPADKVVKFIVDELDEIATYLPVSYADEPYAEIGRATRGAAYALKARTLLYAASPLHNPTNDKAKWAAAAEASKYVIDHAKAWGLKLSRYADLWGNDAFFNKELIFGLGRPSSNDFEMANYPVGVENGSSGNCPTQSLVDQYEFQDNGQTFGERYPGATIDLTADPYEGLDPRFALTVVKNGDEWPTNGTQKKVIETFAGGFNAAPKYGATPTGYYLRKLVDGSCVTTTDNQVTKQHTWIVMRLAEFYLDFAEAAFHANGDKANEKFYSKDDVNKENGMSANEAINVLRTRADINMPKFTEDGEAWVERYERERLVELAFENHRFWDVRRWMKGDKYFKNIAVATLSDGGNTLVRTIKARNWNEKYNLFPIPQSERLINGKLTQNSGWEINNE